MPTLNDMLNQRTWYALWAIAHAHELPFWGRHTQPMAASRLHDQLIAQGRLRRVVKQLSREERAPLLALQAAGGQMKQVEFIRAFGNIRLYRPWRADVPRHPWKAPMSIAEKLWYLALIDIAGNDVYAPTEVLDWLPPLPRVRTATTAVSTQTLPTAVLLTDLAHLLGVLLYENAKVRWGRWLSPRTLKAIQERLHWKDDTDSPRSEPQTERLRFLHYLLEVAGLVAVQAGYLKPTVAAWQWLDQPALSQWQTLCDSVSQDLRQPKPCWQAYRLPAVTAALWQRLLEQFRSRLKIKRTNA